MSTAREVQLAGRPVGEPTPGDFALVDTPVPTGEVVVRNTWMSVDPYMRGRMRDVKSYVPPFEVGEIGRASCRERVCCKV